MGSRWSPCFLWWAVVQGWLGMLCRGDGIFVSGWRSGVKFVVGWCVCTMLVDLSVTPIVEGWEEEGRRRGGAS